MFEEPPKVEVVKKAEEEDPYAEYANLIAMYETPEVPQESRIDCEPLISEFEYLLEDFGNHHELFVLHAVRNMTAAEAPEHLIREHAKHDLVFIVEALNFLEAETNITEDRLAELKAKYRKLSQAVGIINNGVVYHDR